MMIIQRRKGDAKRTQPRVVRKAVVSKTRTRITEEERSIVMEIQEDDEQDEYHPDPDDPIEDYDDFPPARVVKSRSRRASEGKAKADPTDARNVADTAAAARTSAQGPEIQCHELLKTLRSQVS